MIDRRIRTIQSRLDTLELIESLARSENLRQWLHGIDDDDVSLMAGMAERVKAGETWDVILDSLTPHDRARFDALRDGVA